MGTDARQRFTQIHPSVFGHPLDVAALETLQAFKGLDFLCKKVLEYGLERIYHIENIGNRVEVGPSQLPELHQMMRTACTVLDLPPVALFVEMSPMPNAFAAGASQPTIVVTTGLLDLMEPAEIQAVLGHELGHVLCRHGLYRLVARNISVITTMLGQATLGIGKLLSQGLVLALLEWYRKSEFTADRAGLLVCQDVNVMISVMMKLAGGASRWTRAMNQQAFLKQAEKYDAFDDSLLNKAYKVLQQVDMSHPIPVLRAREISNWGQSAAFRKILAGDYEKRPKSRPTCGYCATKVTDTDNFCPSCGAPLPFQEAPKKARREVANCAACLAVVPVEFEACPLCGLTL